MISDDLAPLFSQSETGDTDEALRVAQATLLQWNPETFENIVSFKGVPVTNMPVAPGVDALTFQALDQLILHGYTPNNGLSSWWIAGRVIIPGTGAAEKAIAFLRGSLAASIVDDLVENLLKSDAGEALAAFVIGKRIHFDFVDAEAKRTSMLYGNPTTGGTGPTVADVDITESGRALVLLGGNNRANVGTALASQEQGIMGLEVTGATSISADDADAIWAQANCIDSTGSQINTMLAFNTQTRAIPFTGLNPGLHTFQAKYRSLSDNISISQRSVVVIAF